MIEKIISGGQTGVDRAGLDFAITAGVAHGGFCPSGRKAVDGKIPDCYMLDETVSSRYEERTRLNVLNSDGTLVLYRSRLSGGTKLTWQLCRSFSKPCWKLNMDRMKETAISEFAAWVLNNDVRILNIAGPRDDAEGDVYKKAIVVLQLIFGKFCFDAEKKVLLLREPKLL